MGRKLFVEGQSGDTAVSNGFGLGVRQHDDVMLAYGYSRKVSKRFTLPSGQYAAIALSVGSDLNAHHAESRFVEAYNGSLDFKVIIGKTSGDLTGTPERLPAFQQNGATLDAGVKSLFDFYPPSASNPVGGTIDENNTIDDVTLYGEAGGFITASSSDVFASVRGRHYLPDGFYVALFFNSNGSDIDITYSYDWHEY